MNSDINSFFANERLQRMVIILLLALTVFVAALTINTFKEYQFIGAGTPVTNTITVSGEGEVFAVPDTATFSFSIVEEKSNAQAAQEIATQKVNSILEYLRESGIEEVDLKTTNYNVYPRYEYERQICPVGNYCPPGERVLKGFEVNQTVEVKVRDTDKAGQILAGIGERGVSNVSGLSFTIDDEDELKRDARKEAIQDAEEKAKTLASDLGVRIVRVVSFSESGAQPFFARAETMTFDAAMSGAPAAPELPVGENKITSNVSITYEIR